MITGLPAVALARDEEDQVIFARTIRWALDAGFKDQPVGATMVSLGEHFLGTPYVAHSLEEPGDEHLVINLRGFDCLTLVENCLAISRCLSGGQTSFDEFRSALMRIRYSNGVIDGYASRLHYFTDWVGDNVRKRVVKDVTATLGGEEYRKPINFMSTHRDKYPQLVDDNAFVRVSAAEQRLSGGPLYRIPSANISSILGSLCNGDIIGTVTSMEGMDVSHTGMVIMRNGTAKFLHAPLSGGAVTISDGNLAEYVRRNKSMTGIVVARPMEVEPVEMKR
jgi:hypothetical protein